jgi:hypothetical protein
MEKEEKKKREKEKKRKRKKENWSEFSLTQKKKVSKVSERKQNRTHPPLLPAPSASLGASSRLSRALSDTPA